MSLIKFVPLLGQTTGALSMPITAGAITYAIGKVFIMHFASGGTFLDFDPEKVKDYYAKMLIEAHTRPNWEDQPQLTDSRSIDKPLEDTKANENKVEISHIFYHGKVKRVQSDEYVEIVNKGTEEADISGWQVISSGRGQKFTFPENTVLQPGKSFRIYTNEVHEEWGGFSFGSKTAIWNDKGDIGTLFDADGQEVSKFSYGDKKASD